MTFGFGVRAGRRRSGQLIVNLSALTLSALMAPSALAQTQDATEDEIVVTAQRREQSIQDVPISVSAFSNEQLENLGVENLQDLVEHIPGVYSYDDRNAGQPTWIIRGVGLSDFNSNNTPTAAIYYDEFYLGSNMLGGVGMYDIGRVEVLRGPQGGLYGRNTTGGAIQVLSERPSLSEAGGFVRVDYGSWERTGAQAAVGGPLSDTLAFRLAGMIDQGGGWQDSLATPGVDDAWGDRDVWALRGQVLVAPSDAVEILLKVEGGQDQSEVQLASAIAAYSSAGPGFCAGLANGTRDPSCWTGHNLYNFINNGFAPPVGNLASEQSSSGDVVLSNPINRVDNDWVFLNGRVDVDLGFATLSSISGYLEFNGLQVFDTDASPLEILHEDAGVVAISSWSQEFRLVSNTSSPMSWLLGAMVAGEEINDRREFPIADLLGFGGPGVVNAREWRQETSSWAAYGQFGYDLSETVNVHGSLRYTDEAKDLHGLTVELPSGGFYLIDGRGLAPLEYDLEEHWSGGVGVDWTPSDDLLIYASVTQAQKSGGFFGGFAFTVDEYEFYREETNLAYEVGFKSDMLDNSLRLNGAAFFYDYQDIQGFTRQASGLIKLANLGDAEYRGAELEFVWSPQVLEGFTLSGALSYVDAEIVAANGPAFAADGTEFDPVGLSLPVPEWAYQITARYEHPIAAGVVGAVQLDYSWRDDIAGRDSFGAIDEVGYLIFGREGYDLLNARVSVGSDGPGWNLAVVGRNLADVEYFQNAGYDNFDSYREFANLPRSWAVELGYSW